MIKKIIDYKTLSASYPDELDVKVNKALKEGWQPHGHQFFQSAFHQPMVKYAKKYSYVVRRTADRLAELLDVSTVELKTALANDHGLRGVPFNEWTRKQIDGETVFSIPKEHFDGIIKAYGEQETKTVDE